tara:strand:+ start:1 stop:1185 length:1185 start_codon:yes stop_codon:yes gene_type:complete
MALEIEKSGITINDNSLRNIIKNDKLFFKDNKFSRTEYEKFLLKSNLNAPIFEQNIVEQESRRQFLSLLAGGITVPDILVENEFKKENQIKTIKYIDLTQYYSKKNPSQEKIKELYDKNKNFFVKEFKSIQYAEITPQGISGNNDYNESFFKQLDILENKVLDGQSFDITAKENNLKIITVENIDSNQRDKNDKKVTTLPDNLFKNIYKIKNKKTPEILKVDNKYFLAEIKSIENKNRPISHPDVLKMIKAQLNFQNKIDLNASIIKDISMGGFDKMKIEKFAKENNLKLKEYQISNLKQNEVFTEGIIKRIFLTKDGDIDLITDSTLTKNFLILVIKTQYKEIKKDSNEFKQYEAKARLNLVNKIYASFDEKLNQKYKVELNQKTIDRVKNSF